jgi:N-acyl-D-amino-acid deacylase
MIRILFAIALFAACAPSPRASTVAGILITNAILYDGTGAAPRRASVRIVGDKIAEVGDLRPSPDDRVVDARGHALAPGFIDAHSHHDRGLFERRDTPALLTQGITTIVVGQDGGSPYPLADFFARLGREPASVNVAAYVGHNTLRHRVLGDDFRRTATADEVEAMTRLLRSEMEAGALGLSTGLEYDPGIYSDRPEVIALSKVAASMGGRYISHIRSEDRFFWQAIDEIIAIGRETGMPVQISHAKLAMRSLWGQGDSLIRVLDRARTAGVRITADVYPYTYWQSTLTVLFPARDFENRAEAELVLREVAAPDGLLLGRFDPDTTYVGKTVADIARLRGTDPATTLMALIRESLQAESSGRRGGESVIGTSMDERDVERLIAWPYASISSDGELAGRHPRGAGAFPRVLGRYARERGIVSLQEAIRKMTSLSADNLGLRQRGRIVVGNYADLVLFDPDRIIDRATPAYPQARSEGVRAVWVNGALVYSAGSTTIERPGRPLRR